MELKNIARDSQLNIYNRIKYIFNKSNQIYFLKVLVLLQKWQIFTAKERSFLFTPPSPGKSKKKLDIQYQVINLS